MDGNKDEAFKCLRIGKEALESGDQTRALKFLTKARRLDPSLPIDDLLSTAADGGSRDSSPPDGPGNPREEPERPTPGSASASSFATATSAASAFSSSEGSSRAYTEKQITVVRQIKKRKDYYQILGLERDCTVEDVRKAYRKLSLKVHPDKNRAPGAEEAFKAVSKAFQCLSNEEGRKRYDLVGSEEPAFDRAAARRHARGFDGFMMPTLMLRKYLGTSSLEEWLQQPLHLAHSNLESAAWVAQAFTRCKGVVTSTSVL